MMHLAISLLNFRPGKIGGTETYLRKLIPELARQRGHDRITLVTYRENAGEISAPGLEELVVPWNERQITRARIWEAFTPYRARLVERLLTELSADVSFFPQQSMFPKRVSGPVVMTVHDFQHLVLPRNFGLADRAFRAAIYPFSLRRAQRLITVSAFTKQQLINHYRLPPERATVALLGFEPPRAAQTGSTIAVPKPYVYYPAVSLVHKNHEGLLKTVAALRREGKFPYQLVFSGIQTPYWSKLVTRIADLGLSDAVTHVGYVSYDAVQALYRDAAAVVFPTTYEGFGLPVMEAITWGKKVIVSRLDVFAELGVPACFQIDFSSPAQLAAALALPGATVLERPPSSWADCAATTWAVLRQLNQKTSS